MKPFLGIDLTTDKKNEQFNGDEFLVQETSEALTEALINSAETVDETVDKAKIPLFFRITQYICGALSLIMISSILKAGVSPTVGYQNAPWAYWLLAVCGIVWLILWVWSKQKSKKVLGTDESTHTFSKLDSVVDAIYEELAVPDGAKTVDVLSFFYKVNDEGIKVLEKATQTAKYVNLEFKIFSDSRNLYLANLDGKYAFALSDIVAIRTIEKKIAVTDWNKQEAFNKGYYKQFKLAADNLGRVHVKSYHILEVNCNGKLYGIYFPCYELPAFEEATSLKA